MRNWIILEFCHTNAIVAAGLLSGTSAEQVVPVLCSVSSCGVSGYWLRLGQLSEQQALFSALQLQRWLKCCPSVSSSLLQAVRRENRFLDLKGRQARFEKFLKKTDKGAGGEDPDKPSP